MNLPMPPANFNGPPEGQGQSEPGVARIRVVVPVADAEVTFEGIPTRQRGTQRVFETPPMAPGEEFTYTVTATWREGGQRVTREENVTVRAGSGTIVNFAAGSR